MSAVLQPRDDRTVGSPVGRPISNPLGRPIVDAAFLADPYPTYAALREAGPIHWSAEFFGGAWVLNRYADVEAVLRNDALYSAQRTGGWVMTGEGQDEGGAEHTERLDFQRLFARAMLFVDAPDHARLRGAMAAGFRGEALLRLTPFIDTWVTQRLDALEGRPRFDFMAEIARPLPAHAIAEMMGIAEADRPEFTRWSDDLAAFIGAPQPSLALLRRAHASLRAMVDYFEPLLARRRQAPGADLVSALVRAEAAGQIEPGAELLAQCAMLLFAGHETTRNALGNGLLGLLTHPAQWQRLRDEPALLPGAVRELLRHDSTVQYTGRRVRRDHPLHGQWLRRGDLVVALIGAANRDPARHADPDRLDITRRDGGLMSFGVGPHVCIGAALTQLEMQRLFAQLLQRRPLLRLAEEQPAWGGNAVYRGLTRLHVEDGPVAP